MWGEPRDMDDPGVVRATLAESGFDAERLLARTQEPEVKEQLLENTEASVARGTFGAPTFFVGEEIFFGKDKLRRRRGRDRAQPRAQQVSTSRP